MSRDVLDIFLSMEPIVPIDYKELLKKYVQCLDIFDGYPDEAVGYGKAKKILSDEDARELSKIWDELP